MLKGGSLFPLGNILPFEWSPLLNGKELYIEKRVITLAILDPGFILYPNYTKYRHKIAKQASLCMNLSILGSQEQFWTSRLNLTFLDQPGNFWTAGHPGILALSRIFFITSWMLGSLSFNSLYTYFVSIIFTRARTTHSLQLCILLLPWRYTKDCFPAWKLYTVLSNRSLRSSKTSLK